MSGPKLTPITNPSPREQFRESADNISKHREMVDSGQFLRAVHYALLEYQATVTSNMRDGNAAMAAGFKIQGAIEVMAVMRNLAESTPLPRALETGNLNHKA